MHSYSFLPPVDYAAITKQFLEEITRASRGEKSSISYFRHSLPDKPLLEKNKEHLIQGIVIGGTNYISEVRKLFPDGTSSLLKKETGELPIIEHADVLKTFLREHIEETITALGVNFGFFMDPATGPYGELDGKILTGTKEHRFEGLLGKPVGDFIRNILNKNIPVAVANDTVCLLLAGVGDEDGSLIAGTGFNMGLKQFENGCQTLINLETGNFDKFEKSEILEAIDNISDQPGKQLFEKVISGKYLAEYFNLKAKSLGITHTPLTTSQELSQLSHATNDDHANQLARLLLERSASLVACALAAIYQFSHSPKTLTIIGEGSLLWKGWEYTNNIQKQLQKLHIPENTINIKHIKGSSIQGAFGLLTKT